MFNYKRKNNALNNAASGLERGLQTGIGLGMQARRQQQDEEQATFARDQALKQAKRADDALALEAGQRQAEGAAVDELSAPEPKVNFSDSPMFGPAISAAGATVQHDEVTSRVGKIARKMSEMGTPLGQVKAFLDTAREKHTQAVDDGQRKALVDAIHRDVQSDTLFATQADGSRISNPETEKAAQALVELSGNPNVPVEQLRAERVKLKQAIAADRSRLAHRKSMVMALDTDLANVASQFQTQPGPITAAQSEAQSRQMQRLQTLRNQFDVFYDEIHEAKGGALSFSNQWNDAKNGIAFRNPRTGRPVTFAEEDAVREAEQTIQAQEQELNALKAQNEAKRGPLLDAQAEKARADAAAVPTNAEAKRMDAQANLNRSNQSRPKPDPLDYKDASKIVEDRIAATNEKDRPALIANRDQLIQDELDKARVAVGKMREDQSVLGSRPGNPLASLTPEQIAAIKAAKTEEEADALARKFLGGGK